MGWWCSCAVVLTLIYSSELGLCSGRTSRHGRRHNALDDAENTFRMYCKLLRQFKETK